MQTTVHSLGAPLTGTATSSNMTHALTAVQKAHTTFKRKQTRSNQVGWFTALLLVTTAKQTLEPSLNKDTWPS